MLVPKAGWRDDGDNFIWTLLRSWFQVNFSSEMAYFSPFCSQTCWELFLRIPSKDGLCKLHKPELRNNWFCSQILKEKKKDQNIKKIERSNIFWIEQYKSNLILVESPRHFLLIVWNRILIGSSSIYLAPTFWSVNLYNLRNQLPKVSSKDLSVGILWESKHI